MGQSKAKDFCHFFKFGSLVFLEIAWNDSFEHCLTTSRGEPMEKILVAQN